MKFQFFISFVLFASNSRAKKSALITRRTIRCPSSKRRDDDAVVFRRKGRIIVIVSIARARFSRKSARRAVAKSFLWRGGGGGLLRSRILSLFSLRDGVEMSRPHPTKKRCEHHLTTVFFDGTTRDTISLSSRVLRERRFCFCFCAKGVKKRERRASSKAQTGNARVYI